VAAVFDVIILGQGRDHCRSALDLADPPQDDLRPPVVTFEGSTDFNCASSEAADIAYNFQIWSENDHREWARHLVFAEIQEVNPFGTNSHAKDLARYASGLANVLRGLTDQNAVGSGGAPHKRQK
jgi:hypothetical protein